jgi:hypothetical protein
MIMIQMKRGSECCPNYWDTKAEFVTSGKKAWKLGRNARICDEWIAGIKPLADQISEYFAVKPE